MGATAVPDEWWTWETPPTLQHVSLSEIACDIGPGDVQAHERHLRCADEVGAGNLQQRTRVLHKGEVEEFTLEVPMGSQTACASPGTLPSGAANPTGGDTALLYIHGGGFVASSYSVDRLRVAKWAATAGFAVAYMHYTLAPQARHPTALNQCAEAYAWLRTRFERVVLFGDSAGGNLAAALTVRCISSGLPRPDALTMAFPALNLNEAPGPSRALHLNDPLVPVGLLTTVSDAYFPQALRNVPHVNPYLSPIFASDEVLQCFPPTFVVVGGLDPLLDDSIDFVTRLRRLRVPGSMKVYRSLPHGFFSFDFLPLADAAIDDVKCWVQQVSTSSNDSGPVRQHVF
jgi:acetyl esterase